MNLHMEKGNPNLFKYPDFCGASVIGIDEDWISRTDWDEVGPDILFKKCRIPLLRI